MTEPISGRMARLKPWHYALIGGVSVAGIALIPALNNLATKKKAEDTTAAMLAANASNAGEPWHPPTFPAAEIVTTTYKPVATPPPPPPPPPTTPNPLVTTAPTAIPGSGGAPADYRMFGQRSQPPPAEQVNAGGGNPQATHVAATAPDGSMGAMLKPTETTGYNATRMTHPWATIEQGRIIACNAVTPMTSELPGFVKAKVTHDVRSADGTTTLIDRNSDIFGEIAHGLSAGQDRLFVLWRSITTPPPDLVRITLNSPTADELGEAGLPGDINNHMWKRIGGALLLSGVDALLEGAGAGIGSALSHGNNSNGSNLNFYQFQGQGQGLAASLMQHTIEIPDTLHRDQALPCSIFVSGDLDFNSVYQLRRRAATQ
jgi:type IV secretion system protein VirB10